MSGNFAPCTTFDPGITLPCVYWTETYANMQKDITRMFIASLVIVPKV